MQLLGRLEIKSKEKIKEFLDQEHVGRIASIDENGYPQIIPMNFVFIDNVIYMHSHTKGEKLDNVVRNEKVGFEVDRELEFLPSYFEHPTDASVADTLYISVVIKGKGALIKDGQEKILALNGLMKKYQPEGKYEPMAPQMPVLDEVTIIKITPDTIRGKYKIGQNMHPTKRMELAKRIHERNLPSAKETLEIMGFTVTNNGLEMTDEPVW
jgi:nitroimidazol reductase NimA-like FMN-containing flavoprotein (pyridoxamine 5'-phosphate oxidase superfamily)